MPKDKIDFTKYLIPMQSANMISARGAGYGFILSQDLVNICDVDEAKKAYFETRRKSMTDFALDNMGEENNIYLTDDDKFSAPYWLANPDILSFGSNKGAAVVAEDGAIIYKEIQKRTIGIAPNIRLDFRPFIVKKGEKPILEIFSEKTKNGKCHYVQIGEYPKDNVSRSENNTLEELYNNGNLKEGIKATGRLFTTNGQKNSDEDFLSKQNPEFIVDGQKYVRVIDLSRIWHNANDENVGDLNSEEAKWVKVSPITFKIKNWNRLSRKINPHGKFFNGDTFLNLEANESILSGLPFYPNGEHEHSHYWQNSLLRCFLNSESSKKISKNCEFDTPLSWDFTKSGFLYQALNLTRGEEREYVVSECEKEICDNAFAGCVGIDKIYLHGEIERVGKNAFAGCGFKFLCRKKNGKGILLSKIEPQNKEDYEEIVSLEKYQKVFIGFDIGVLIDKATISKYDEIAKMLLKDKFQLPFSYAKKLMKEGDTTEFDFRFLNEQLPNITKLLEGKNEKEKISFFKFASALGCFTNQKMHDKDGKQTNVILAQKASSLLAQFLKKEVIRLGDFASVFDELSMGSKPNEAFVRFLSVKGDKNEYVNMEMLLNLDKTYPNLFVRVMNRFDNAKQHRTTFDKNGRLVNVSWEDALKNFYILKKYQGVTRANYDIANVFSSLGLSQRALFETSKLRQEAERRGVRAHILGKPLKEELSVIGNNQPRFTFEMLDKHDPRNAVIGALSSCCASVEGVGYGKDIAVNSVLSPDVQNLVIRDRNGEIVAKGAMYVNEKDCYAVINEFEINRRFKKHEISSGYYSDAEGSWEAQERQQIFDSFMRGIAAFIEEYDKLHPNKPLKKVNVGMGYNRLKLQCEKLKAEKNILKVPSKYSFMDAQDEQRVIYDRKSEPKDIERG